MHANQTPVTDALSTRPVAATSITPSEHLPARTLVRPPLSPVPAPGGVGHDGLRQAGEPTDDESEEAGYGHGV